MDPPQPATRPPGPGGQPRPAPAPGIGGRTSRPGADVQAAAINLAEGVASSVQGLRAVRWFRASSALVRWIVLVILVGVGAALLTALTIQAMVSLIPTNNS